MALPFVITTAGREALVNAANTGTDAVVVSQIALGSTHFLSDPATVALAAEIKRIPASGGGVVAPDTIHVTGSDSSADVYTVRSVGLYTSGGILLAVYSQADPILIKGAGTVALIAADLVITGLPAGAIAVGDTTFAYPQATEVVKGVAELATVTETLTGTDDERIVTPKKLAARTATQTRTGLVELATTAEAQAGADTERALTPAAMAAVTATPTRRGLVELATAAEAQAGVDTERVLTPAHLGILASEFFKMLYPIGEILITRREGSPATWLNFGLWERYGAGRVLAGFNPADADFNALDKTGGAKTITLSTEEIPGHTHTVGPFNGATSNEGLHRHQIERAGGTYFVEGNATGPTATGGNLEIDGGGTRPTLRTTESGGHAHTFTIAASLSGSAGGGGAHSNVQPYITVFMWKRIA
jgi:microcystin-dependent protein